MAMLKMVQFSVCSVQERFISMVHGDSRNPIRITQTWNSQKKDK